MPKTAHKVEISRAVTFTEWAQFIVYADTPEEARAVAQAEAERINADPFATLDAVRDDGEHSEWEAQEPEEPDEDDLESLDVLGPEPDDA